jgi:calcium-dependent protein kinase
VISRGPIPCGHHADCVAKILNVLRPPTKLPQKVIDFGLSKKFNSAKVGIMHEGVGTLYSMAPQVLQGIYTSQADMWSCGVITYMLLSSHRPFYNKKRKVMIDRIMRCDYTFDKDYWHPVSAEAKDFISRLLVLDPKVRSTSVQAQQHIWMSKEFKLSDRAPTAVMSDLVADNLLLYKHNASLKKIALNVIAHQSTTEEVLELRKAFDQFDTRNNGVISFDEFKGAIQDKCSLSEEAAKELFDSIDVNHNGVIMYTEFIAATLEAQGHLEEDRIAEAFDRLDADQSGFISKENMLEFLGADATMEDVEAMLRVVDRDNDGMSKSFLVHKECCAIASSKPAVNLTFAELVICSPSFLSGIQADVPYQKQQPLGGCSQCGKHGKL